MYCNSYCRKISTGVRIVDFFFVDFVNNYLSIKMIKKIQGNLYTCKKKTNK